MYLPVIPISSEIESEAREGNKCEKGTERGSRRWSTSVKAGLVNGLSVVTLPHVLPPIIAAPVGLMDPPTLTMLVGSKEFDIADEAALGCLEGGGDPPSPAVEADPPDADVI